MKTFFANLKNTLLGRYRTHPEAVIIATYFNPQKSVYRKKAFDKFYSTIKHLNHRILEVVIGDAQPELPATANITRTYTKELLWHKESALNHIVESLPAKFKYVFWVDADVLFTNKDWLVEGVKELQTRNIIQPFYRCFHLEKDQTEPDEDSYVQACRLDDLPKFKKSSEIRVWRSFCATNYFYKIKARSGCYDEHGHVGFAWGARREVLEAVPLYDKALIGGADHIIAHAAAGHIPHACITKSFTADLDSVTEWSERFDNVVQRRIGFVRSDLYHIWHGDLKDRRYLKRIQEFTPVAKEIKKKDRHGFYVSENPKATKYVSQYFSEREVVDDDFMNSVTMGLITGNPLSGRNIPGSMLGAALNDAASSPNPSSVEVPAESHQYTETQLEAPSTSSHESDNANFS